VFEILSAKEKGAGGEIQLTDAMIKLMGSQKFFGLHYDGRTYDTGSKIGFLAAQVAYGLERAKNSRTSSWPRSAPFASPVLSGSSAFAADIAGDKKKPVPAPAPAAPAWDMTFGARIVSDYNFRGISQTDRKPGVQGYAELSYQWLYAGVAANSVDLPTKPSMPKSTSPMVSVRSSARSPSIWA
jgi:hypothetical protein